MLAERTDAIVQLGGQHQEGSPDRAGRAHGRHRTARRAHAIVQLAERTDAIVQLATAQQRERDAAYAQKAAEKAVRVSEREVCLTAQHQRRFWGARFARQRAAADAALRRGNT